MCNLITILKKLLHIDTRCPVDVLLDDYENKTSIHPLIVEHAEFEEKRHRNKCIPRYVYSRKNIKYFSDGTMYCDSRSAAPTRLPSSMSASAHGLRPGAEPPRDTGYPYTQSEIR